MVVPEIKNVFEFPKGGSKPKRTCHQDFLEDDPQYTPGESTWMVVGLGTIITTAIIFWGCIGYVAVMYVPALF